MPNTEVSEREVEAAARAIWHVSAGPDPRYKFNIDLPLSDWKIYFDQARAALQAAAAVREGK